MGKENELATKKFAESISCYLQDAEGTQTLRPHQREVFEDFYNFFLQDKTKGYIELPTGTGKTVLFVELSKALLRLEENSKQKVKILVVVPTKDLVHQTLGQSGEKGYGKFAPELKIGSFFSDTPDAQREQSFLETRDVVVTTYRSLNTLANRNELIKLSDLKLPSLQDPFFETLVRTLGYEEVLEEIKGGRILFPSGRKLVDIFNLFFFDEAHHLLGGEPRFIVGELLDDKVIIGFSATPDASESIKLNQILPTNIHRLELNEAIGLGLLAPIAAVGLRSGIKIQGSNIYDETGDYIENRISYLANDPGRNRIILDAAKIMVDQGIGTIISCIAGNETQHAKFLAEQLTREGINATAIHANIPATVRQRIYRQFENGQIDVLTYVGVLSEGWDSKRAKALINARPTRSIIFSKQRLGRITRPGALAFAIDIQDEVEDQNPAITIADVLNEGDLHFGTVVGNTEDKRKVQEVLDALAANTPVIPVLTNDYQKYQVQLDDLKVLTRGVLKKQDRFKSTEYAIPSMISSVYVGVTEEILTKIEQLTSQVISNKFARQGNAIRKVYNVKQAGRLLYKLPEVNPRRYYIDAEKDKWISAQGLVQLFAKRFPGLTIEDINNQLEKLDEKLDWIPARYQISTNQKRYRRQKVIKLYSASDATISLLSKALTEIWG